MKVGILTYHRSVNYGAYLQAYCLQKLLSERTGYDVEIIDYDSKSAADYYKGQFFHRGVRGMIYNIRRHLMFTDFRRNLPLSKDSLVTDDIDAFNEFIENRYDLIVVGSDEVWNVSGFRPFPNAYWLPKTKGVRKVTYAISGRNRICDLTDDTKDKIQKYIDEFEFITVRDGISKKLIDGFLPEGKESSVVCDPTMAYDFSFDREVGRRLIREKFHVDPGKKVIAIMDSTGDIIRNLNEDNDVQFISLYSYYPGLKNNPNIKPEEWVQIIAASDGLITAFYHGMCIALSSNTPFLFCEERDIESNEFSKGYDLLHRYEMEDHYIRCSDPGLRTTENDFINKIKSGLCREDFYGIKKAEKAKFDIFVEYLKA